ncbi:MAG: hypothetical protein JNL07_08925, partial [Rhodospirillales bacterium]|nr:hypothetical protein [Rhodospirillales bacterium]
DRRHDRDDGPSVVGFGEFTPAFLSRPVPRPAPRVAAPVSDAPAAEEAA